MLLLTYTPSHTDERLSPDDRLRAARDEMYRYIERQRDKGNEAAATYLERWPRPRG